MTFTLIWGPSESSHKPHAACILNRGSMAPSRTDVNPPLRLHTAHRYGFCGGFFQSKLLTKTREKQIFPGSIHVTLQAIKYRGCEVAQD